jgi:hypothetical protein
MPCPIEKSYPEKTDKFPLTPLSPGRIIENMERKTDHLGLPNPPAKVHFVSVLRSSLPGGVFKGIR